MAHTADLTCGPIRRQLIELVVPLLLGNILQQLYNTVDAVIVGRFVGEAAFAAVGVSGSVMNLFLFLISGGCAGAGILFSQFHGAGDGASFRKDFWLFTLFGAAFTLTLTVLGIQLTRPLLRLLQTPAEVLGYAVDYLHVIFMGFLAAFAFHLCSTVLRSVGSTGAALCFLMISMGVNLGLDILFVARLGLGVAGAAWATVAAQALAAGLCALYLRLCHPELVFRRGDMRYDGPLLRRTIHFSFVSALHMCNLYIGKLAVQGAVNGLGTSAISAYTAALRLEGFANSFGDSGAAAMSVFVGQNTGAGDKKRVREGFETGQRLLAAFSVVMMAVMLLSAEPCLKLVLPADSGDSLAPALGYYRLVACFYLFNFLGSGLAGYFRGLGRVNVPVIGATGHITFRAVCSFLLTPVLGLPAVALATGIGWVGVVTFWYTLVFLGRRRGEA